MLDGDWLLAVASYNSGEGNVLKSVRRNKAKSQPIDFWHLKLSRETSSYVPKLIALVEIVRDPAAFGLVLPEILYEPQFVLADIATNLQHNLLIRLRYEPVRKMYVKPNSPDGHNGQRQNTRQQGKQPQFRHYR